MRRSLSRSHWAAEVGRVREVAPAETWVVGRILVRGVGEFFREVDFPATFQERPLPILGGTELDAGEPKIEHFPSAEMAVTGWKTRDATSSRKYYTGAYVAIRVAGRSDQAIYLSYAFAGKALSSLNVAE